jgi:hypothetical protein
MTPATRAPTRGAAGSGTRPTCGSATLHDGGTTHQAPESGQDNFFYARIRNRSATRVARHAVVTFTVQPWAGHEFSYPADWLPPLAAVAAFDIGPGEERIVSARWPRKAVPPAGTHVCWLAAVISRGDHPAAGGHTWESNSLAQKNLVVMDVAPDRWWTLPFVAPSWLRGRRPALHFELVRPAGAETTEAMLVQRSGLAFDPQERIVVPAEIAEPLVRRRAGFSGVPLHLVGADRPIQELDLTADPPSAAPVEPSGTDAPRAFGLPFPPGARAGSPGGSFGRGQLALDWHCAYPRGATPGDVLEFDLLARDGKAGGWSAVSGARPGCGTGRCRNQRETGGRYAGPMIRAGELPPVDRGGSWGAD